MRRMIWTGAILLVLAACTPTTPPVVTSPAPPVIGSFSATPATAPAPLTTALRWTISDANNDPMTCRLDADGDGILELTIPGCTSSTVRTASFPTPTTRTLTLEVTDGNTTPVTQTLLIAATAPSADAFTITVRINGTMTPAEQATFATAAARWQQVIRTGLPDTPLTLTAGECGSGLPAFDGTVDDVLIDASIAPIDGVGNVLGFAGPCVTRTASNLPVYGAMQFDSADIARLETSGQLADVILHEMGHVLGFGTVWTTLGVLQGAGGSDPRFTGPSATGAWQALGQTGNVPVENSGGAGTTDSHWRESTFGSELMTGYINALNPLSAVTAASFADLGYGVDLTAADPYGLPALRAGARAAALPGGTVTLITPHRSV